MLLLKARIEIGELEVDESHMVFTIACPVAEVGNLKS